ncbi:MAG: hypothetical protein AAGA17_11180 [Actinomycetota bacterium]
MRRPGCRGVNEYGCSTVTINMKTPTGNVAMESCSACDQRWWHVDGEQVHRAEAFDGLAAPRR